MSIRCVECIDCGDLVRASEVEVCDGCHEFICEGCINEYEDKDGERLSLCIDCYNKRIKAKKE